MNLVEIVKDYIDGMVMQWPGSGRKALILDKETLSKSTTTTKLSHQLEFSDPVDGLFANPDPSKGNIFHRYALKFTE